jgi:serine protease AprX
LNTDLRAATNPGNNVLKGTGIERVVYSESFVPGDASTFDAYGHGTHVAGIVGGDGADSAGPQSIYKIRGIAPGVNLINLRVLDQNGDGNDSSVIAALQRVIQLKDTYNIRVVNVSLGRPVYTAYAQDPLCQAVESVWKAGIVVVVAAGNGGRINSEGINGYATITAPGNDPYVITVGAMNTVALG